MRPIHPPSGLLALTLCASCLGATPATPAGDWVGECHVIPTAHFELNGMLWVTEGEDILQDATGTWALYTGTAVWDDQEGGADIAQCVDRGGCTLQGLLYRPQTVIVLFYTPTEPALVGLFEGGTMSGDCFDGGGSADFTAARPER